MPKVSKPRKTTARQNPLAKSDGNARKKPVTASSKKGESKASKTGAGTKPTAKAAAKASVKSPAKTPAKTSAKTSTKTTAKAPVKAQAKTKTSAQSKPKSKAQSKAENFTTSYLFLTRLRVLQIAYGWANCHMYTFRVDEFPHPVGSDDEGNDPEVGFMGRSLLYIQYSVKLFNDKDLPPNWDSSKTTLADIIDNEKYAGQTQLVYEYDMGNSYEHDIIFLGVEAPSTRRAMLIDREFPLICLGGEGHPYAEDIGPVDAFEELKELFAKPRSRDPEGLRDWYKNGGCANGDPTGLDPYKWNILDVNDDLGDLAKKIGILS